MLGAGLDVAAWFLTSIGFSVYIAYFADYEVGSGGTRGAQVNAIVYQQVQDER